MALKMELYTRAAWHAECRPIRVFRAKDWISMTKRMRRFVRDHKKSAGGALWGELSWRSGNQKGFSEHFDSLEIESWA